MDRFFLYDPEHDGFEYFANPIARDAVVQERINAYLDTDGWNEDVERIVVGEITGKATACDIEHVTGKLDDNGEDEAGVYWPEWMDIDEHSTQCNYRIKPLGHNNQIQRAP